jgi:hypothetical protein
MVAVTDRQKIVVHGSVESDRTISPPVLQITADAATRRTPRR